MLPDEQLPVRLMNTLWGDTDGSHEDLRTIADLDEWLDAVGADRAGAHAAESELARARALREALRRLAAYITRDTRQDEAVAITDVEAALGEVNESAAEFPAPSLALRDGQLEREARQGPSPVTTALAQVAVAAIELFGGEDAARLRPCYAPGCVLYFVKTHPRRAWCSVACGNRVRAARHYQRARDHRDNP
jgi:predicted RNA-binding Zn ribbon-like protein